MQTHSSSPFAENSAIASIRFAPPVHVKRWTGRNPLTLPLPSLAALRIEHAPLPSRPDGGSAARA